MAAALVIGLFLLLHVWNERNAPTADEMPENSSASSDPSPTLVGTEPRPTSEPIPATARAPGRDPTIQMRVTSDGAPVPGATVSVEHVGSGTEADPPGPLMTDEAGRAAVQVDASLFPLALVVRAPAPYVPKAITLASLPDDEILVDLETGQPLTVRTIDMDRKPLAGISVVVYPIGHWAQGNSGMTHAPTGWLLEDSRRVTTGADGSVVVEGLDPSRHYRAHAPGYGTPAQIVPPPKIPQPKHDAVPPGAESTLVLMLAPLRTVWARAVDASTGEPVSMPWFRVFFAPNRRPHEQDVLMRAVPPGIAYGVLDLSESVRSDDYFRMYVMGRPGPDEVTTGPLKVDAPGYETVEVLLPARAAGESAKLPVQVRLERKPDAVFAPLTISLQTKRPRVRAIVQLRQGPRDLLRRGFDTVAHGADIEARVALGNYELLVGGNLIGTIDVRGSDPIHRTVDLDDLPSLQISLKVGGVPYSGIGSVAMTPDGPGPTRWMFIHFRVPYHGGLSPHVVVPAGGLTVAAGTGDGRYPEEYEHPSVAPGEKATIEVRLP